MDTQTEMMIKDLAALLRETGLNEIDYEKDGLRLRVAVGSGMPVVNTVAVSPVADKAVVKEEPQKEEMKQDFVKSPIVGVVYLAPNPNAANFVKVGDSVKAGQTLCIVEAMKTFNPVVAQKAGVIKAILVESGAPVEYQQPLFEME